jgi:hypothetical protein
MKTNHIVAINDKFDKHNTTSIGFFLFINPDIVFRDAFHNTIVEILQKIDPSNYKTAHLVAACPHGIIPVFDITYGSVSSSKYKKKYVNIKVLDFQCPEDSSEILKELMRSIDFSVYFKKMIVIPVV